MSAGAAKMWTPGSAPVAVVMICLNEAHNLPEVFQNLRGWAQEVFLVDSFSVDESVDIALENGARVFQRRFTGFGDQWNAALKLLPISAPWTMKLDPDERLSDELKAALSEAMQEDSFSGFVVRRRLWLMGKPLPVMQPLIRIWRTGKCRFADVAVNEHPLVEGAVREVRGFLEHFDSPDLDHWLEKQNRYTTAEAIIAFEKSPLAEKELLWGTPLQRRMWIKKRIFGLPMRYTFLFLYHWLWQGAWRAGWVGYCWARLRADVIRLIDYKRREMELMGKIPVKRVYGYGKPDKRATQLE
jgi:glycosyltransferase involved in cell wall biosynthesis